MRNPVPRAAGGSGSGERAGGSGAAGGADSGGGLIAAIGGRGGGVPARFSRRIGARGGSIGGSAPEAGAGPVSQPRSPAGSGGRNVAGSDPRGSNGPIPGGGGSGGVTDVTLFSPNSSRMFPAGGFTCISPAIFRPSTSLTTDRRYVFPGMSPGMKK